MNAVPRVRHAHPGGARHRVASPDLAAVEGFDPRAVLAGFEHVNRYYDRLLDGVAVKILPGEYYVTRQREAVVTVLGSCVSACIRDPELGLGGMNHFMLPRPANGEAGSWAGQVGRAARYGSDAMEHLINAILKAGGARARLEVKIFGGGRVLPQMTDVGRRNIEFVRHYLGTEGLRIAAEDVGSTTPRHVQYFPQTGRVRVKHLRVLHNTTILDRERGYLERIEHDPLKGEVELF